MPEALVITGLGNEGSAREIQEALEAKGYTVTVVQWDGAINYDKEYNVVISHSAGTVQAQVYASHHPDSAVYLLSPPFDVNLPNTISVGQRYDPVSIFTQLTVGFDVMVGGKIHSKNTLFGAIVDMIPYAKGGTDMQQSMQVLIQQRQMQENFDKNAWIERASRTGRIEGSGLYGEGE